ncbi:ABC transporter permease [Demequina sp. NBRC 110055]|uniref:ABC transporter permease n=1 Tax=Demequina sp. NBRC 110055 TaxID=1570344 RepID=UPI0009FEB583|nr:ABC transporter permease [Demequina sp. NBRC 110055]
MATDPTTTAPATTAEPATASAGPTATTPAASAPTKPSRKKGQSRWLTWGPPLGIAALIIAAAYIANAALGDRSFLLPAPHAVLAKLWDPTTAPDMWTAAWRTTVVSLTGLAIAIAIGVTWAIIMNQTKWMERALFPYAVMLQAIPILAITPLIGFWFGYDFTARVVVCVIIALFPMVSNTLFGLQSVERGMRELFQLQGASRGTVLRKLELPAALPAIFAGMRISAGLSVVGAIVGEFFFQRGTPGLGSLINKYSARLLSEELFASVLVASLLGVAIFLFFGWLGKRAVGKWYDFG